MTDHRYAMIMAGGAGTRLWPLSRQARPKPLLSLVDNERSMFQISVERLLPLIDADRIYVVANPDLCVMLNEQTPDIPAENFIEEPRGKDTAPAVGLGALHIRHRDPDATMAVLTADHYIADEERFRAVLEAAFHLAGAGSVVTLGITPTYASTGFGYIERGRHVTDQGDIPVYELSQFVEKPAQARAEAMIADERYSWNSGMFIWPVARVMAEFEKHAKAMYASLGEIANAVGSPAYDDVLKRQWNDINPISVDYALMENIQGDALVIPVEMGWSDIGNFGTLYDILSEQGEGGTTSMVKDPVMLDSGDNLVFSTRLVATLGIEDLVIIDTDDVLLVCHRSRVQDVKKLVETLKKEQRIEYL